MAGIVTAADKTWMAANFAQIAADWGTTGTIRRLIRNGSTGQVAAASAHLTGVNVYIEAAKAEIAMALEAPIGEVFKGVTGTRYTVPTQIQLTDLLTTADGTVYQIAGITDYPSHLELVLTRYVPDLNA